MNEYLIKLRFGLTIDLNRQEPRICPECGHVVCRVIENDEDVFCVNTFCSFHDKVNHGHYERVISRIEEDASSGCPIFFNDNHRYPHCNLPVILNEDFQNGRYIIRDARLDSEKYARLAPRGRSKNSCIDTESPIIAQYYSLLLLVKDGWVANHDRELK